MNVADVLSFRSEAIDLLAWRAAFEAELEERVAKTLDRWEPDGSLAAGLALLSEDRRRRFLRAPAVMMLFPKSSDDPFPGGRFVQLLFAELAEAGLAAELPESLWSARGDRLLDRARPEEWSHARPALGDTGITLDDASPFPFPDCAFGLKSTIPHDPGERELAVTKVLAAASAIGESCAPARALVTTFIEVLALRREPDPAELFHSSTFSGCAGLVRFTNAHLASADQPVLIEALVHEAVHCLLHVFEEIDTPFVRPDATDVGILSPWTGNIIRLQSYVHACAVWYAIHALWSAERFAAEDFSGRIRALQARARSGFEQRAVERGLAAYEHLLRRSIFALLRELEARVLDES